MSQRLHRTIDENLHANRVLSAGKGYYNRREEDFSGGESMDDRMRIFEDEIIKRIKIIQNFVKNMDGKVNRVAAR